MSEVLLAFLFFAWAEQVSPIATVIKFDKIPSLTDRLITGINKEFPCPSIFICARNCFGGVACPAFSFSETNQICHLFKSDFRLLPGNRLAVDIGITAFVKTGLCPGNYIIVGGACLRRSSSYKPYDEAQVSCSEDGGELVQVKTRYLMNEILKFIAADGFEKKIFYTGATDTTEEGTWSWNDGTPVSEWCKNEPNDMRASEDCLELRVDHRGACLNDINCKRPRAYICQVPSILQEESVTHVIPK